MYSALGRIARAFNDVRAKIFQSIEFFFNFYCSQIMSYLCQKGKNIGGGDLLCLWKTTLILKN